MQLPSRNARAALLAGCATLVLAAPASANPVPTVSGKTITIAGDDTAESITIAEAAGQITLNGADVGAAADGTFNLLVNAGGGDDNIAVNTNSLASVIVNGGAGDDLITGSNLADALRGDDGNDRVVGRPGDDDMDGGAGNDVLVWNNGDNSDDMDGDAGTDEIEVNGAATAGDVFTVAPNGQRVRFDRTNLVPFNLDISAERMVLNGLGGADNISAGAGLAPLIAITMNGGVGSDSLSGGDGADLITGGDAADVLAGNGGGDRIVGDRGDDTMTGGAGDDTLVWNNGDNSDTMDGQDGLDRVEVNGAGAGDVFTIAPNGARAKFDRTNLVPFTLDVGSTEALDLRGLGGDDSFNAASGTPLAVIADGGSGNDAFAGAGEPDTFLGDAGDDTLTGGAGPDALDGQDGNDTLLARDGAGDLVRGGTGADSAQVDAADVVDGVESVDAPDDTAPELALVSKRLKVKGGKARVRIGCPAGESECKGKIRILRRGKVVGRAKVDLAGGETRTFKVKLNRKTRIALAKAADHKLRVTLKVRVKDAAGNTGKLSQKLRLRG